MEKKPSPNREIRIKRLLDDVRTHQGRCKHPTTCSRSIMASLLGGRATFSEQQTAALVIASLCEEVAEMEATAEMGKGIILLVTKTYGEPTH